MTGHLKGWLPQKVVKLVKFTNAVSYNCDGDDYTMDITEGLPALKTTSGFSLRCL